jgi:hypothetical protein
MQLSQNSSRTEIILQHEHELVLADTQKYVPVLENGLFVMSCQSQSAYILHTSKGLTCIAVSAAQEYVLSHYYSSSPNPVILRPVK